MTVDFEAMASTVAICGSPAEVVDRMGTAAELLHLDTQILMFDLGGLPDTDLYRAIDLTGQEVPATRLRENRRWMIEDYDFISSYHYHKEGTLSVLEWLKSFRGLQEAKWFSWRDPVPFVRMSTGLLRQAFGAIFRGLWPAARKSARSMT